jgi:hypothetical protein
LAKAIERFSFCQADSIGEKEVPGKGDSGLHDSPELIQEAGNGKLHKLGTPFYFGVGLRNPILKWAVHASKSP